MCDKDFSLQLTWSSKINMIKNYFYQIILIKYTENINVKSTFYLHKNVLNTKQQKINAL